MTFRYIAPSRPLPPACRWLLQEGSAHLLWNAGCIAMVMRDRNGKWHTQIQWRMAVLQARCGSQAQGMRWVERWMEKRTGLPGSGARREVRQPAWVGALSGYARGPHGSPPCSGSSHSQSRC
ncbi:hypothetical protein LF41_624 [Lysobacter dokdonensis DS-58]|uniref:Uncharacterized protein n=1 Tax=Lysobacter dokdonensis DS-58 TaxID=1300345 RepID=A0A0A2WFS2_9GAMM|nr:hypothetical protein [Lysobacter dokdonensis]KGQ18598.1 hypothetical protein LF41_624 [Lysobacter dokdonensis DS-58]